MTLNNPLNYNGWETLRLPLDPFQIRVPDVENAAEVMGNLMDIVVGAKKNYEPFELYVEGTATAWVCGLPVYNINFYTEQTLTFTSLYNWVGMFSCFAAI